MGLSRSVLRWDSERIQRCQGPSIQRWKQKAATKLQANAMSMPAAAWTAPWLDQSSMILRTSPLTM
jgi:hypothetical protein